MIVLFDARRMAVLFNVAAEISYKGSPDVETRSVLISLKNDDMIREHSFGKGWVLTERGEAFVEHVLSLKLPVHESRWVVDKVDPRW